jgi:hypothetical protein
MMRALEDRMKQPRDGLRLECNSSAIVWAVCHRGTQGHVQDVRDGIETSSCCSSPFAERFFPLAFFFPASFTSFRFPFLTATFDICAISLSSPSLTALDFLVRLFAGSPSVDVEADAVGDGGGGGGRGRAAARVLEPLEKASTACLGSGATAFFFRFLSGGGAAVEEEDSALGCWPDEKRGCALEAGSEDSIVEIRVRRGSSSRRLLQPNKPHNRRSSPFFEGTQPVKLKMAADYDGTISSHWMPTRLASTQ